MILGIQPQKTYKVFELVALPGTGKSLVAKACAQRTGASYFNLPSLDLAQPVDRNLLASLNNVKSLIKNPKQWGDVYFSYLNRIEEEIISSLQLSDVWVTNYTTTLNVYQKALGTSNKYKSKLPVKKVYLDLPVITKYSYENIDFLDNYATHILDFKKALKTQLSFVPIKETISINYRQHPAVYLNEISKKICEKFDIPMYPYKISDELFAKKE